jgi:hypothetical protein
MLVLDSNLSIHALSTERPVEVDTESLGAVTLFGDLVSGRYGSVVTAYMATEIERGCRQSDRLSGAEVDSALTKLYAMLERCESIHTPFDSDDLGETTLTKHRNRTCNRLVGDLLDVQTKDVPILFPAYDRHDDGPVVLTADAEFAGVDLPANGLSGITVEGLDLVKSS